jgi:membrane protein implicated in regulation of membrane protease activity
MVSFHKILADGFFVLAFIAAFAAMVGWLMSDIWLASTQWVLIGIFSLLVAIYTRISEKDDEKIIQEYQKQKKSPKKSKK